MKRFLCLLIFLVNNQHNVHAQSRFQDSLALVDLYNSTNGANWRNHTNWLTTRPIEQWFGITINQGRVQRIDLPYNQLSGIIPNSLGNLSELTYLVLQDNQLNGNIPTTLGNLLQLGWIYLNLNQLSGSIPSTFGRLSQLRNLSLNDNQLTGNLPDSLGNVTNLQSFNLDNNRITGSIPATFERLSKLSLLVLSRNQLSGSIPTWFGNLPELWTVDLGSNQLSGSIPASLGNLSKLYSLNLWNNKLTGTIPNSFGKLSRLRTFLVLNNQLSGSIPDSLANATNLNHLDVSNNQLTGKIPDNFRNLNSTFLYFSNNKIDSMPNLAGIRTNYFVIDSNQLTFDDILPNLNVFQPGTVFFYGLQKPIFKDTTCFKRAGDPLFIDLGIDAGIPNNKYEWYKNDTLFQTNIGNNKLIINLLQYSSDGIYTCKVTNSGAPYLTLYSRKIKVSMDCSFPLIPQQKQICEGHFYRLSNGRQVNQAGIYRDTLNCDTVLVINLSILSKNITPIVGTTCNPSEVGVRDVVLQNRFGCDSIVRTTRTLLPIVTRLRDSIVCLFRDTQTIIRMERSFKGCDSTIIQTLRLPRRDTTIANAIVCDTLSEKTETTIVSYQNGCQATVVTRHVFDRCECLKGTILYNALIPNDNDAKNNYFMIQNLERYAPNELVITDKRNELVYQVTNYNNDWSGTNSKGEPLPEGVYNYLFRMTDPISKQVCKRIGVIHIQYIP
jgi:hypothetical protein